MRLGAGFVKQVVSGEFSFNHGSTFHRLEATEPAFANLAKSSNKTDGLSHRVLNVGPFSITLRDGDRTVVHLGSDQATWIASDGESWSHMGVENVRST